MAPPRARLCLYTFGEQKITDTDPVEPFGLAYIAFAFYLFCAGVALGVIAVIISERCTHAHKDVREKIITT